MVCPVLNSSLPLLSRTISVAQQSRPVFHLCARRTFSSVGRKGNWAALSTALVRRSLVDIRSAAAPRPSLTTATATRRPQQHLISTAATARGGTWQAYRQSGLLLGLLAVMSYNAEPVECESVAEHLSDESELPLCTSVLLVADHVSHDRWRASVLYAPRIEGRGQSTEAKYLALCSARVSFERRWFASGK